MENEIKEKIGIRLRQLREEHQLSQEQLAQKMEVSQKTISSWEKDRTYPKIRELHRLCAIYGCTYAYLTGTKQYDSSDITLDDIMFKLSTLDEKQLAKIQSYIERLICNYQEIERMTVERKKMEEEKKELEQKLAEYDRMIETLNVAGVRRNKNDI